MFFIGYPMLMRGATLFPRINIRLRALSPLGNFRTHFVTASHLRFETSMLHRERDGNQN
jgi:hypothetical protein